MRGHRREARVAGRRLKKEVPKKGGSREVDDKTHSIVDYRIEPYPSGKSFPESFPGLLARIERDPTKSYRISKSIAELF